MPRQYDHGPNENDNTTNMEQWIHYVCNKLTDLEDRVHKLESPEDGVSSHKSEPVFRMDMEL